MKDLHKLTPFKYFVLTSFPYIEADFDALTNYELYSKICEYINEVAKNNNDQIDNFNELYSTWLETKEYIDNYFENLDVTEEINNKLDEMANNGTLDQLVLPYFQEAFGDIADVVTNWLDDNIVQETGYVLDKTLTVEDAGADAKAVGDRFELLKAIENLVPNPLIATFTEGTGINSSGNTFSSPMRIATEDYIPLNEDIIINLQVTNGYRTYYAYYNSAKTLISTHGWYTDSNKYQTIPAGAKYMRICIASVGDVTQCTASDYDKAIFYGWTHFYRDFYRMGLKYKVALNTTATTRIEDANDIREVGVYRVPTTNQASNLPSPSGGGSVLVLNALNSISTDTKDTQLIMLYFDTVNHNLWGRYCSTGYVWRDWYRFNAPYDIIVEKTKWLAIGDSITYGVYSDGDGSHGDPSKGWVTLLSNALNYTLQNDGVRGMGYIATGSNEISFEDDVLPQIETYDPDDYNLITVALGINDYNTSTITLAQLETIIKSSMQRIATHFPNARIIYITPFNSNRRGTASDNYCYGYSYGGRTLKDIADLIKECADEVGIECIYASNGFLFNNYNMSTMLPDDTHPSITAHKLIAKNMAHYLLF